MISSVATSLSGFGFSLDPLLPYHYVGFVSLLVLAATIPARYVFYFAGPGGWIYVIGAATALYLNVFVLIAQAFAKVPALKALAPTQKEFPLPARAARRSACLRETYDSGGQTIPG